MLRLAFATAALGAGWPCVGCPIVAPAERIGPSSEQQIWVAAWGDPGAKSPFVVPMVVLEGDYRPLAENASLEVEQLASRLRKRPAGRRALLLSRYANSFVGVAKDAVRLDSGRLAPGPWCDTAIAEIANEWPRTLQLLKTCEASIDLLVADIEAWGALSTWGMSTPQIDACRRDPRWRQPWHGMTALGVSLKDLEGETSTWILDPRNAGYLRWNLEIGRYGAAAMNQSLWAPAVAVFPKLAGSNYQGIRSLESPAVDMNGHHQPHDNVFGNASSPALYGEVGSIVNLRVDDGDDSRVRWNGARELKASAWLGFLIGQQQVRGAVSGGSARGLRLMPWIANSSYGTKGTQSESCRFPEDLRCYDETVRHAATCGTETFLWWRSDGKSLDSDATRIIALIEEVNDVLGGRTSNCATSRPLSLLAQVVISGSRKLSGKWIWRVTASPEVAALREVGTGREWAPTADTLGFWVETADRTAPRWEVARRRDPSEPSLARPVKPAPPP